MYPMINNRKTTPTTFSINAVTLPAEVIYNLFTDDTSSVGSGSNADNSRIYNKEEVKMSETKDSGDRRRKESVNKHGGKKNTEKCGECGLTIKDSDKAVSCDVCEVWFHIECEKLREEVYNFMQDEEAEGVLMWYCSHCKKGCAKLHKLGTLEARTVNLERKVDSSRATGSVTEVKQEDNTGKPEPVGELIEELNKLIELNAQLKEMENTPQVIALQEVKPKHYRYERITAEYNLQGYDIIEQNLLNKEGRDLYKDEEKVQKTVNDQEKADVLSEQFSRVFIKEPERGIPTANKKDMREDDTTRGNTKKIYKTRARLNLRRHSFPSRVVNNWNGLPEWVVNVETVEKFEAKLDKSRTSI
ncbi:putative PHD-finger-containing protein 4, partial [Homarus americanus]